MPQDGLSEIATRREVSEVHPVVIREELREPLLAADCLRLTQLQKPVELLHP